ncbi:MAG: hypothetical protein ISR95_03600 [Candidatus Marinimicrobia bacterium]|nr:hypothetical protein [FCB group bacterium]MBL7046699.1 hypothetical protein [Candidatus Neomarinimicrobiota bacterium]
MSDPKSSKLNFQEKALIAMYAHLTYCYEAFDHIPILWLYMPKWCDYFKVEHLIKELCNNPLSLNRYPIQNDWDSIGKTIEEEPVDTLIITQPNSDLVADEVRPLYKKDRYHLPRIGIIKSFIPTILITSSPPPEHLHPHVISFFLGAEGFEIIPRFETTNCPNFYATQSSEIERKYSESRREDEEMDILFPLEIVAEIRCQNKLISQNQFNAIKEELTTYSLSKPVALTPERELFPALEECLTNGVARVKDDWQSLDYMCTYLHLNTTAYQNMKPQPLSRLLNRLGLLIEVPKRLRYDETEKVTGNKIQVQRSCIRIDQSALGRLL